MFVAVVLGIWRRRDLKLDCLWRLGSAVWFLKMLPCELLAKEIVFRFK